METTTCTCGHPADVHTMQFGDFNDCAFQYSDRSVCECDGLSIDLGIRRDDTMTPAEAMEAFGALLASTMDDPDDNDTCHEEFGITP